LNKEKREVRVLFVHFYNLVSVEQIIL